MRRLNLPGKSFLLVLVVLLISCGETKSSDESADSGSRARSNTADSPKKIILVFGDSLTAGYGLDDPSDAFPGVLQARIDSLKLPYRIVNSGVSGETSAGGLSRTDWILKTQPDIFILELGANDGLRGFPVKETEANLQAIIDKVKTKFPSAKIILAGMQVPPSMGQEYISGFKSLYPALAEKNHIGLVPFLLEGVGGNSNLNQRDGIHPNKEGAKIVAENVWRELEKGMREKQ